MFHRHDKTAVTEDTTHQHGLLNKIKHIGHHHDNTQGAHLATGTHVYEKGLEPTGQTIIKDQFAVQQPVVQQQVVQQPIIEQKVVVQQQVVQPVAHAQAYDISGMDSSHVVRTVVQDAPVVTTTVIEGGSSVAREIVHVVPVIHQEIHQRDVIYKDIIHEKHFVEKELHEVPIHMTEHVKHDVQIIGNMPQQHQMQRQVIQENAIVDQQYIQDQAVLRKVVEHERSHVTKEVHERALVNKEIIHERPIIEREVRENAIVQKEFVRDGVIVKNNIGAEVGVQREFVNEGTTHQTQFIKEKPLLVSETLHERPIIQKEIYNKNVITKDITHEQPIIERHLVEKASHTSETVQHGVVVNEKVIRDAAIYETVNLNLGTSVAAGQKLRWLDQERFEIQGQGTFRRYHQQTHGNYQQLPLQRVFIMKKGILERFSDKLHHWNSLPAETIYVLE